MSDIGRWTKPKARKAHTCELCGRTIRAGETYHRYEGIFEGSPTSWKECEHCAAAIREFDIEGWEGYGVGPDEMGDWEPRTVTELRNKVYYSRQWRRPNGDLYPMPERVTA